MPSPGSFTSPGTAVNGGTILSLHVNTLRDNQYWFHELLGHPEIVGQVPISTSGTSGAWAFVGSAAIGNAAFGTAALATGAIGSAQWGAGAIGTAALAGTVTAKLVPAGLGGWVRQASEIPSGWSRESSFDGRFMVGVGTVFGQTFDALTDYGSAWTHAHAYGAAALISGGGTTMVNFSPDNTVNSAASGHSHSKSGSTSAVGWLIPSRAYVAVRLDS